MNTQAINTRRFLLPILLFCLTVFQLQAQGFIGQYPFYTWSQGGGQAVYPQANGTFRMTALSYPDFGNQLELFWMDTDAQGKLIQTNTQNTLFTNNSYYGTDAYLLEDGGFVKAGADSNIINIRRYDADGSQTWSTSHALSLQTDAFVLTIGCNAASETFIRGYSNQQDSVFSHDGFIVKVSATGTVLWESWYDFVFTYVLPTSLVPTADGGCLFNNYGSFVPNDTTDERIMRFDGNGEFQWHYGPYPDRLWPHFSGKAFDLNNQDQTYLFVGEVDNASGTNSLRLDKLDPNGNLLDSISLNTALGLDHISGNLLFATADGGTVVVVQRSILNSFVNYVAKIDADGNLAWQRPLGFISDALNTVFHDGKELSDGTLILYGYQGNTLHLIKFSPEGVIYPHSLTGQIARDSTFNCVLDSFDPPLEDWIISATRDGLTQYTSSDANGAYTISDLDSGSYEVVLVPPSYLWQPCIDSVQHQFTGVNPNTDTLDFPVQALYDCPLMEVDIATPFLRRCFANTYALKYCNAGNQAADPAVITVLLDPLLELDSASIPFTQNGQLLTFDLGTVPAGVCESFNIYTTTSCDSELGQTLCVEAHVYPDTICAPNIPNWSGAQIEVSAQCESDSVRFIIQNTGAAAMPQALDFIIVDDHVITREGMFQLPAGGTQEETVLADGTTWRIIADQEPGFPFGPQMPTVGVEACLANPGGPFSIGMLNMFPNYSGNPFHDIDCRTVVGAYDPNDKQALPLGVDNPHYIDQNQPIEYLIRFQNTGTDTAFTVVIRDSLSASLNPGTIRPGAASHPYSWKLSGNGILTVTFDNIMLPDSNVNVLASQGFVQFQVDQNRDVPFGTVIENSAGIYFDFNTPVITNTVFHTVGKDYLLTAAAEPHPAPLQLRIWPNPAVDNATIQLDKLYKTGQRLLLRDMAGRFIREWNIASDRPTIPRAGLEAGLYWLELRESGQLLGVGKLIWMD